MSSQKKKCGKCSEVKSVREFYRNTKRGTGGYCKDCAKSFSKENYRKNADKVKAAVKRYNAAHPEKIKQYAKTYREKQKQRRIKTDTKPSVSRKTKEEQREYQRQYRKNNPDKFKQYNEKHREKRLAYSNEYRKNNKEYFADYQKKVLSSQQRKTASVSQILLPRK